MTLRLSRPARVAVPRSRAGNTIRRLTTASCCNVRPGPLDEMQHRGKARADEVMIGATRESLSTLALAHRGIRARRGAHLPARSLVGGFTAPRPWPRHQAIRERHLSLSGYSRWSSPTSRADVTLTCIAKTRHRHGSPCVPKLPTIRDFSCDLTSSCADTARKVVLALFVSVCGCSSLTLTR
jgi:hypothetical protein